MTKIFQIWLLFLCFYPVALSADGGFLDGDEPSESEPVQERLRREIKYETNSKPTGWMRHKCSMGFRSDRRRTVGIFFVKSQSSEDSVQSHALGFHAGQNLQFGGFRFGISQTDRSYSESSAKSSAWGSLRVSPLKALDLFARYGRTWSDLIPRDEEDVDWGSFSAGFKLRAWSSLAVRFLYTPEKRMRCEVSCRW